MEKLLLITVDCDLRTDDVSLRQDSLDKLLEIFNDNEVGGHTTWFLNENDFLITKNHQSFLQEAIRRGDTLGIHDHVEPVRRKLKGEFEVEPLIEFCGQSKSSVEEWLTAQGHPDKIIYHRNGCLVQHPQLYAALKELGYTVVSEVWSGNTGKDHAGYLAFDNRALPFGISPYRHDDTNFDDYQSTHGHFLHFPVMHMYIRTLDFSLVDRWVQAFSEASVEQAMFVWLFHPYEIMNKDRTAISEELSKLLDSQIKRFADEYQMTCANMEECLQYIN